MKNITKAGTDLEGNIDIIFSHEALHHIYYKGEWLYLTWYRDTQAWFVERSQEPEGLQELDLELTDQLFVSGRMEIVMEHLGTKDSVMFDTTLWSDRCILEV